MDETSATVSNTRIAMDETKEYPEEIWKHQNGTNSIKKHRNSLTGKAR